MPTESRPSVKRTIIAFLLRQITARISDSCRIVHFDGEERFAALLDAPRPVILSCWHNQSFFFSRLIEVRLIRRGFRLAMMASLSRDGELAARVGAHVGVSVVRGSQARQGTQGLRALYRAMTKEGQSIVILPDGSRGPVYVAKQGAITLSMMTGCPIVPMAHACDRFWEAGSWDRLVVPKPFARVAVQVGESIHVPPRCRDDAAERYRLQLEATLNDLTRAARRAVSGEVPAPVPAQAKG